MVSPLDVTFLDVRRLGPQCLTAWRVVPDLPYRTPLRDELLGHLPSPCVTTVPRPVKRDVLALVSELLHPFCSPHFRHKGTWTGLHWVSERSGGFSRLHLATRRRIRI